MASPEQGRLNVSQCFWRSGSNLKIGPLKSQNLNINILTTVGNWVFIPGIKCKYKILEYSTYKIKISMQLFKD